MTTAASPEDAKTSGWGIQTFASFRTNCTTFVPAVAPLTLNFALTPLLPL